ncbi:MAG: glycosyltransferase family 2 protein [Flavobacteriales bacterium]
METSLAIVILNFNGKQHLARYLPSVLNYSGTHSVIVADNASTDDSISLLKENFPAVRILEQHKNFGFAGGYNLALAELKGQFDYYMILNSDVEVSENWLNPLQSFLDEHPHVAACQPKIKAWNKKGYFEHAGAAGGYIDLHYFPFCRGRIFDTLEKDEHQYDFNTPVTWTSGAAMLIRAELFHQVKGFDSDFFAHMEEIDLCLRLGNLGYQFYCVPASTVYHLGGGTLDYESPKKVYLNFRNSLFMLMKNHCGPLMPSLFIRMCLDGIAGVKFLLSGQFKLTWMVFLAHLNVYAQFGRFYKKRRQINTKTRKFHRYNGRIIWDYYFLKNKTFNALNKRKFH